MHAWVCAAAGQSGAPPTTAECAAEREISRPAAEPRRVATQLNQMKGTRNRSRSPVCALQARTHKKPRQAPQSFQASCRARHTQKPSAQRCTPRHKRVTETATIILVVEFGALVSSSPHRAGKESPRHAHSSAPPFLLHLRASLLLPLR